MRRHGESQLLLFEPYPVTERVSLRARCVRVDVRRDGEVVLTIPRRTPRADAHAFLDRQRAWIERTRERLLAAVRIVPQRPPPPPGFLQQLRAQALAQGRRLLDEESARLGLPYADLRIRDPRTRWGSCGADGRIMLSVRLALAPPEVFRYVAIHELCHLRWRGHGPRFWALVERHMPDYATHRAWLHTHGDALQAWPPRQQKGV